MSPPRDAEAWAEVLEKALVRGVVTFQALCIGPTVAGRLLKHADVLWPGNGATCSASSTKVSVHKSCGGDPPGRCCRPSRKRGVGNTVWVGTIGRLIVIPVDRLQIVAVRLCGTGQCRIPCHRRYGNLDCPGFAPDCGRAFIDIGRAARITQSHHLRSAVRTSPVEDLQQVLLRFSRLRCARCSRGGYRDTRPQCNHEQAKRFWTSHANKQYKNFHRAQAPFSC